MLHPVVHGQGEVIRVLLVSLELGRSNLPSFLQVTREREGEALHIETEAEDGSSRHPDPHEAKGDGMP